MVRSDSSVLLVIVGIAAATAAAFGLQALIPGGRGEPDGRDRPLQEAIADVEAGRKPTPVIGGPTETGEVMVTFLARRDAGRPPRIVSDVTGWGEHLDGTFDFAAGTMAASGDTGWFFLQARVAPRARIEYRIAYGQTDYRFDPHNPRRSAGAESGGAEASEFVTPGYLPPQEFADPRPSPAGSVSDAAIEGPCRTLVYTPAGHSRASELPVVVFLDLRTEPISRVLDWLIARGEMQPVIAAFVGVRSHADDRCSGEILRHFVAGTLPEWLSSKVGASRRADQRAVIAISYGAKDALDMALADPAVFGCVGLLVPGRRITRTDIDMMAKRRSASLRVAILAGRYDLSNLPTAQGLRDAFTAAGHTVDYLEVNEGHNSVTWRNNLRPVLLRLFGAPARVRSSLR